MANLCGERLRPDKRASLALVVAIYGGAQWCLVEEMIWQLMVIALKPGPLAGENVPGG
jgi:hypothetical protein